MRAGCTLLSIALLFLPCAARAQTVPALVNYQGRLANPDGSPLPTADYTLTFNVFDAATNGALVWGPQVFDGAVAAGHGARIPVVQGYFNVMLGPVDTTSRSLSDAFTAPNRFVEIAVSNRPPIAPRQQILTTPFAFQAVNSAKLAGYDWSAVFGTNNPVAGTIPFGKLAQRAVGTNVGVGGVAVSSSSGLWSITSGTDTPTLVPNLDVRIATSGRPIVLKLISDGTTNEVNTSDIYEIRTGGVSNGEVTIVMLRDGQAICNIREVDLSSQGQIRASPSRFSFIDFAPSANYQYTMKVYSQAPSSEIRVTNVRLVAYEL